MRDESMFIDPRGPGQATMVLAERKGEKYLAAGTVLFFNNTKLDTGSYSEIFPRIQALLSDRGIKNFDSKTTSVRGMTARQLREHAASLACQKPAAAVVGLGDMGVTPATTLLVMALEQNGIPTAFLTAGPGAMLARGVAFQRAGQLCLCELKIFQGSGPAEIRAEVDRVFERILGSLSSVEDLPELAEIEYPIDREPATASGYLPVPPHLRDSAELDACDLFQALVDYHRIGDGLPLLPTTPQRVERMASTCPCDGDTVLIPELGPTGRDVTVRDAVVAATMAGCKPEYLPIVIAALRAMADERYNLLQALTTSHPGGNLILVSGPLASAVGLHGGPGCMGPGFRANATIGRSVNLTLLNVGRAVPGVCDLDCLSSPADFTYCFAEDPLLTPWSTMNEEYYDAETSCVYVLKAEGPHDILDLVSSSGESLMETLIGSCTTIGSNNAYLPGNLVLVLTPDHARLLARDGYDKAAIREAVHRDARIEAARVRGRGLIMQRPGDLDQMDPIPVTRSPADIDIIVAGGPGGHSAVILPWALRSEAVLHRIETH